MLKLRFKHVAKTKGEVAMCILNFVFPIELAYAWNRKLTPK